MDNIIKFFKTKKGLIYIGYILVAVNLSILIARYLYSITFLQRVILSNNFIYLFLSTVFPFAVWIFSTTDEDFNYYNLKKFTLLVAVINGLLTIYQPIYSFVWKMAVPIILKMPVNKAMTEGMIVNIARMTLIIPFILFVVIIVINFHNTLGSNESIETIAAWKLKHSFDLRKDKDTAYDFKVVKNLETKKTIVIKENDRFVHSLVDGATGTGKTSSTLITGINNDLDKKIENNKHLQEELLKMVKEEKAVVQGPVREFKLSNIKPKKKYAKEYEKIVKKYPDCGISVMAPNAGLTDDVVKLCRAKGLPVNVIDPTEDEDTGKLKEGYIGVNPFYVPEDLSEEERVIWISDKAVAFSDVLVALNEGSKGTDEYFKGINEAVTTNVAMIVMRGIPIKCHRQPDIIDVQRCIDDFSRLKPLIDAIEEHYNIAVKYVDKIKKDNGSITLDKVKELDMESKSDRKNGEDNLYYDTIVFVKKELLGEGAEKLNDQSRGLRNLIKNKLLNNPRVKAMLTTDNIIDFDKILHNGEITVVNTAAELGDSTSTALGLFILLNFKQAVMRRKKKDRKNHFWYIDEFPTYLHPATETMFTLFRQYRVAMIVAIQTLDQMEKNANTKYLKGVITNSCGTQILFGRVNPSEMKIYSELGGVEEVMMAQKSTTRNSIFADNTSISMSERITPTRKNVIEGAKIRQRDFQEVTIFTIDEGRIIRPQFGKVSFLPRECFESPKIKEPKINWNEYVTIINTRASIQKDDLKRTEENETLMNCFVNNVSMTHKVIDDTMMLDAKNEVQKRKEINNENKESPSYPVINFIEDLETEMNKKEQCIELKNVISQNEDVTEPENQTEEEKISAKSKKYGDDAEDINSELNEMTEEDLMKEEERLNKCLT